MTEDKDFFKGGNKPKAKLIKRISTLYNIYKYSFFYPLILDYIYKNER